MGVGFACTILLRAFLILRFSLSPYVASALGVMLPCILLCFFLSRYRDGRFFFTYLFAINLYLVIRIVAVMAASLFPVGLAGVWAEMLIKLTLLGIVVFLLRKSASLFCAALSEDANWNALGVESIFATGLLLRLIADLDRFENRKDFYPDLILFCVVLMLGYAVILRTIKMQRDKKKIIADALKASEEAGLAKMEFLSHMSHEIRTPLNAIIGLSELGRNNLNSSQPNRAEGLEYVNKILDASRYLLSIINDILDMSKIENSEISLVQEPLDGLRILDNIRTIIGTQAAEKGICFLIENPLNGSEHLSGDATRVKQVLINLLNNAVKFTPQGGMVRLTIDRLAQSEDKIVLRFVVSDTGVGISPEFLPHLFEPFAQEYAGTTSVYGGSGLGLAIARKLTRMMNGDLTVKSKKGEGSAFTAVMEFSKMQETERASEVSVCENRNTVNLQGKKILVCEDHPLNILVIRRILEQKGCSVTIAENGQLGVSAFRESAHGFYDAVLMDIRMPEMDGLAAARAIRASGRTDAAQVPIIAMTANAYEEDVRLSLEAGMNAHLAKPIEPEKLYRVLWEFIDNRNSSKLVPQRMDARR